MCQQSLRGEGKILPTLRGFREYSVTGRTVGQLSHNQEIDDHAEQNTGSSSERTGSSTGKTTNLVSSGACGPRTGGPRKSSSMSRTKRTACRPSMSPGARLSFRPRREDEHAHLVGGHAGDRHSRNRVFTGALRANLLLESVRLDPSQASCPDNRRGSAFDRAQPRTLNRPLSSSFAQSGM
jgi:hypothetical protein